jgi:transcriptional regulator
MFVRSCWQPRSTDEMYALIDANPWALLVSAGAEGPLATNLPLLLDRTRGPHGVLVGHIALVNEQARALRSSTAPVLAVFHGPYSYVTSSWYPRRQMPPTYYYTAVHCYGHLHEQSRENLEASLEVLTESMESAVPSGWHTSEIPHAEITRRLPAIMGFEIAIERIEGKFKLGQDEPKDDALAVADHLAQSTDHSLRVLADAVRRHNSDRAN